MHVIEIDAQVVFQALSDSTRVRVVRLLAVEEEEACLCELVDSLREPQYKLSRHVKILRQVGILAAERDGRFVYHRLMRRPPYLVRLYDAILALPDSRGRFATDLRRFRERVRLRESGRCRIGIQTPALAA
ncbi:MAG: metalloregulator ArsR/SmtB family transcription factor [Burkholderiales bacterium]